MKIERKRTKQIKVGEITIGGDAPVRVQSMTSTDTRDISASFTNKLHYKSNKK